MVNALLKLGQRADTIISIYTDIQRRYRLDAHILSSKEFIKELDERLKGVVDPDEAEKITREIVKRYGGERKKIRDGLNLIKPKIVD